MPTFHNAHDIPDVKHDQTIATWFLEQTDVPCQTIMPALDMHQA